MWSPAGVTVFSRAAGQAISCLWPGPAAGCVVGGGCPHCLLCVLFVLPAEVRLNCR